MNFASGKNPPNVIKGLLDVSYENVMVYVGWGVLIMSEFLPKEVREGLEAARKQALRQKSRLRVHANDTVFPVLRFWESGFSLDSTDAPNLRGLVDLYDGAVHLYQCLIIASEDAGGEMIYDFKRNTAAVDKAPLDFVRDEDAPVALLT